MFFDFDAVFVTAVAAGGWRIPSAAHFAERHGLMVILALGESVGAVAMAVAVVVLARPRWSRGRTHGSSRLGQKREPGSVGLG